MISLDRVSLTHQTEAETVVALDAVSLEIPRGQLTALFGASGSGKTTLINVIAGLAVPDSGTVEVNGTRLDDRDESTRAQVRLSTIGVVFQDHNLISEFTALENVMLPLKARGFGRAAAITEAERWLERVGLSGLEKRMPARLSGGQRQRVGIARALAGERPVLVADEPTGSLDSGNSSSLFELLRDLSDQGVTIVVASHDPLARDHAERIVTLRDGSIVADALAADRAATA